MKEDDSILSLLNLIKTMHTVQFRITIGSICDNIYKIKIYYNDHKRLWCLEVYKTHEFNEDLIEQYHSVDFNSTMEYKCIDTFKRYSSLIMRK